MKFGLKMSAIAHTATGFPAVEHFAIAQPGKLGFKGVPQSRHKKNTDDLGAPPFWEPARCWFVDG